MHIACFELAILHPNAVVEDMETIIDFDSTEYAQHHTDTLTRLEQRLVGSDLNSRELGMAGESYAARWLEQLGWCTLARNWHTRYGELDVIMLTPEQVVVFVEVKTRHTRRYGPGQEAVSARKQAHLRHAAALWLAGPGRSTPRTGIRFDVVAILVEGRDLFVNHIKGAF
ncbi:putative endonuclease [Bifidobacterium bohemicum]|uniref:UPF0102 protein BBOH_0346 n=2 Tax=Bifidobacterium bohemicum TaxID=638617 RepID=A0A086ZK22_9BIFI|nr:endonuclease [Bifidobacterium bohemicum DSM 22767]SCB83620.1 putative endonuclease [Bifidobacterium bohemicum]